MCRRPLFQCQIWPCHMLLLGLYECKKAADNIFAAERSLDIHPNIIFARKISMMHRVEGNDLSRTAKAIPACPVVSGCY